MTHPQTAPTYPAAGVSRPHESAAAQVAGAVTYIDDIPEGKGTLHAAPILSNVAHGKVLGLDAAPPLALPGVPGVVLGAHIPANPFLARCVADQPPAAAADVVPARS